MRLAAAEPDKTRRSRSSLPRLAEKLFNIVRTENQSRNDATFCLETSVGCGLVLKTSLVVVFISLCSLGVTASSKLKRRRSVIERVLYAGFDGFIISRYKVVVVSHDTRI